MKKLLFFFCLLMVTKISFSQQDLTLNKILPPSPEASAFIKYGTYTVGAYTGRPDITIPIYDIKTNKISVPVSLSYDATGIRVNEAAGWAGMNWSLNAGGIISCIVVGQPDVQDVTGLTAVPPRAADVVNNPTYYNYLKGLCDGNDGFPLNPDAEPDKYYYSFNGHSGSFVFDRNRNIIQIPKTSVKITVRAANQGFNITDENGTVYIFTAQETTGSYNYSYAGASPVASASGSIYKESKSAYYLSEIVSSDGLEHVYFNYENETTSARDESYSEAYGDKFIYPSQFQQQQYHEYRWSATVRVITMPRLKTISFANGKIEFTRASGRLDDGTASRLDEITVYNLTTGNIYNKLKSFKLTHGYYYSSQAYGFRSALSTQTADRYRLRLDNITLKDAAGANVAAYSFAYNSVELAPKTSCSQDWQGYYNGKSANNNNTLVPVTSVINGLGQATNIGGADRNSDELYMKAGTLEKITYPTGGYTVFETEAHKLPPGAVKTSEVYQAYTQGQSANNFIVSSFSTPSNALDLVPSSGQISITIGPYAATDPQPFVKIKDVTVNQEQTYISPDKTLFYSINIPYTFIAGHAYQITSSCYANQSYAVANINASFDKWIQGTTPTAIGGLRIKSIKNYNSDNSLANEEWYKYGLTEDGYGTLVGIPGNAYSYGRSLLLFYADNFNGCWNANGNYMLYTSGLLFDQAFIQGSPVVYTDVVKYYGSSSQNSGKTTYNYGTASEQIVATAPLPTGQQLANYKGILIINDVWKKGLLKKQQEYKNNSGIYSLVQETANIYSTIDTIATYGFFGNTKFERVVYSAGCLTKNFNDYAYAEYPVNTGYIQLTQSTKKLYNSTGTDFLQTVTNYTYDNIYKDFSKVISTTNSKQQTTELLRKYAFNKTDLQATGTIGSAESTAIDNMLTRNTIAPVLEETQTTAGVQTSRKRMQFEFVNSSVIAPVNLKFQVKSNPIETRINFNQYDLYGNLLEQQKVNDFTEVFLWGYNSLYPVAKILNTTSAIAKTYVTQSVLDNPGDDVSLRNHLNNLRSIPGALVTTYTYEPLVGMTSQTDANNRTMYYTYDAFKRLQLVKDQDGNIVKKICYNYAGQVEDCSVNVSPLWTATGNLRCVTSGGVNTGYQEAEQRNNNPNSATYNQLQWVSNGYNTTACPLPAPPCGLTGSLGFTVVSSNFSSSAGVVSFYMVFYPTNTMTVGSSYLVAKVTGSCKPSSTISINYVTGGRTWQINIYPTGEVYWYLLSGTAVPANTTVFTSTLSYNI